MIPALGRSSQQQNAHLDTWKNKLVGKFFLEDGAETSLDAHEVVRASDLPSPHRVLPPNNMMTMDYRTDRLNVHLDSAGRVTSVNYG